MFSQHQESLLPAERVISDIEEAHQTGKLSYDQSLRQKFYAAFDSDKLLSQFSSGGTLQPLRCAVPLISEYKKNRKRLGTAAREELEIYVQETCSTPPADESYLSESGRFLFHYTLQGEDAVPADDTSSTGIPDYIERAEFAADSTWNHLIGTLGFEDPVLIPSVSPYEIYFKNSGSYYGLACSDEPTSYMIVHNNFEDFPPNDHSEGDVAGALFVTVAHEFKHASQYTTNKWEGPESDNTISWLEMDGVMIEDIIFNDVNDYYNYIKTETGPADPAPGSIFGNPGRPIPQPRPTAYGHATWMLYFAEKFGMEFWVDVWRRFLPPETRKPFLEAVEESLVELHEADFEREHTENMAWHLASGPSFAGTGFGFQKRDYYPDATIRDHIVVLPDSSVSFESLQPLAGHFIQSSPHGARVGHVKVTVDHENDLGVGLVGLFLDGSVEFLSESGQSDQSVIDTSWEWGKLDKIGIAVVNTDQVHSNQYRYKIESVMTEQIVLFQNYPNPFRESTRIQFTVDAEETVRLDIFDVLGRRVKTLTNQPYEQGLHSMDFETGNLASGVYIYRLKVGDNILSRKMMHIK